MHFFHRFARSRRHMIRLCAYTVCMGMVLFTCICTQMHRTQSNAAEQNRLYRTILSHMNEENDALRGAILEQDTDAILRHTDTLCGYISLTSMLHPAEKDKTILSAIADTAQFYSALAHAIQNDTIGTPADMAFWQNGTDTISAHIADIALSLSERHNPRQPTDAELDAAAHLSAFSSSFRAEPLRFTTNTSHRFRFDREPVISTAQARQILRKLLGNSASFLCNTVTDDAHGCYVFSCQNGYAEISRCGGHLLSYAFYPHGNINIQGVLLSDSDLAELAAAFLKKAGLPSSNLSAEEDRHGIRTFSVQTNNRQTISVGIRVHDGHIVQLQAEAYYAVDSESKENRIEP